MPRTIARSTLRTLGTGHPRLHPTHAGHLYLGESAQGPIRVRNEVTVIGSDPSADIVIAGLAARHAEIRRTDQDEYVIAPLSGPVTLNGRQCRRSQLHTGDLVACGPWTFSFARDPSTDHIHVRRDSLVEPHGVAGRIEHLLFLLYGSSTQARTSRRRKRAPQ